MKALTKLNENKTMCIRRRPFTVRQIFLLLVSRRRARSRCASCDSPFLSIIHHERIDCKQIIPFLAAAFFERLGKVQEAVQPPEQKRRTKCGNSTKAIDIAVENVYNQVVNAYKILVKEYFQQHKQTI